ncbi:MAG: hypothetical protein LBK64_01350 [Spirochaetaceae bacterium]|jgi:hypothetical protein|nr:hypothetical protein [Spirochaetaceae bacterium]
MPIRANSFYLPVIWAMLRSMTIHEYFIVFPEGDTQEIPGRLTVNALVDINGRELAFPLPTNKMIVFRVERIKVKEDRGGSQTLHFLEQLSADELLPYLGRR